MATRGTTRPAYADRPVAAGPNPGPTLPSRPWPTMRTVQITMRGNPINTVGDSPAVGASAPAFTLVGSDLAPVTSEQLHGKPVLLNIFPSVDTPVCAASVRTFNARAAASG